MALSNLLLLLLYIIGCSAGGSLFLSQNRRDWEWDTTIYFCVCILFSWLAVIVILLNMIEDDYD